MFTADDIDESTLMRERVAGLKTLEDCERFTKNVLERNRPDLAEMARKRALHLRVDACGAKTQVERDCFAAVYAYDDLLTNERGRRSRVLGTWSNIKKCGVLSAVERAVQREPNSSTYAALRAMGLQDYAFEALVLRYPESFSARAAQLSKDRLAKWKRSKHSALQSAHDEMTR